MFLNKNVFKLHLKYLKFYLWISITKCEKHKDIFLSNTCVVFTQFNFFNTCFVLRKLSSHTLIDGDCMIYMCRIRSKRRSRRPPSSCPPSPPPSPISTFSTIQIMKMKICIRIWISKVTSYCIMWLKWIGEVQMGNYPSFPSSQLLALLCNIMSLVSPIDLLV